MRVTTASRCRSPRWQATRRHRGTPVHGFWWTSIRDGRTNVQIPSSSVPTGTPTTRTRPPQHGARWPYGLAGAGVGPEYDPSVRDSSPSASCAGSSRSRRTGCRATRPRPRPSPQWAGSTAITRGAQLTFAPPQDRAADALQPASTLPAVRVRDITKVFGRRPAEAVRPGSTAGATREDVRDLGTAAVVDASFDVRPGEIFVVMGLSGSGKSTLIRMLNGLLEPSAGTVEIGGSDRHRGRPEGSSGRSAGQSVSMVFQHFALLPHRTVIDNVAYGLEVKGVGKAARLAKAREVIELVGLEAWEDAKLPIELSGGMQQRVGLARALAAETDILLMDEAFTALDPLIRREMQEQLVDLQASASARRSSSSRTISTRRCSWATGSRSCATAGSCRSGRRRRSSPTPRTTTSPSSCRTSTVPRAHRVERHGTGPCRRPGHGRPARRAARHAGPADRRGVRDRARPDARGLGARPARDAPGESRTRRTSRRS